MRFGRKAKKEKGGKEKEEKQEGPEPITAWLKDSSLGVTGIVFQFEGNWYQVMSATWLRQASPEEMDEEEE